MSFEHCLAAIAETWSLDGRALQGATQLVYHESCKGFAFDVFRDDQQGLAKLGNLLEQRERSFMELIFFSWLRISAFSRKRIPCAPDQ